MHRQRQCCATACAANSHSSLVITSEQGRTKYSPGLPWERRFVDDKRELRTLETGNHPRSLNRLGRRREQNPSRRYFDPQNASCLRRLALPHKRCVRPWLRSSTLCTCRKVAVSNRASLREAPYRSRCPLRCATRRFRHAPWRRDLRNSRLFLLKAPRDLAR